jgi:hypothetical protein
MPMISPPHSMWRRVPAGAAAKAAALTEKRPAPGAEKPVALFFRADDIGVPGKSLERLTALFIRMRMPVAYATVPAWLTAHRWRAIRPPNASANSLICWHQHGFRHVNHESTGKKSEFGHTRDISAIARDINRGKARLETIMGSDFTPIFTPPWNRLSEDTLEVLVTNGFSAVSRSDGEKPPTPPGLADVSINVDLHTRREFSAQTAWEGLFREFSAGGNRRFCGVMIHHRRMNDDAFTFLADLLAAVKKNSGIRVVDLPEAAGISLLPRKKA